MTTSKRWKTTLGLMTGGALAGVFLIEIVLRVIGFPYPAFYRADRYCGWALRPGVEGWFRDEGEVYVRINSEGLHDREHPSVKPPNTLRIAVLGDSYAEAMAMPTAKAFWAVMERELSGCKALKGRRVEVINFGVSGYGTAQELMTLRHRVWEYSPDVVLLAFSTGNDVRNNSQTLEYDRMRPFFIYRNGDLLLDTSFLNSDAYRWRVSWL